jgi:anti-anti-sigma factor
VELGAYAVLDGVLDISRKDEITRLLRDKIRAKSVTINLSRVEHIDSTILGLLVSVRRRFLDRGGAEDDFLLIVERDSGLARMFEITGLDRLFSMALVTDTQSDLSGV